MKTEEAQLMMLKGALSELPQEQRDKIMAFKARLEDILNEDEENACIAFGMIGLERVIAA